ncbi:Uncharacterised protein [Citrobacter koseri]|uniref:hypothetical protein n=1 Tax=Enterobacterales TaxID=91347 RepID=UPI000E182036|nr:MULTISPECIES: hypothetical protein [Enterobacteriaceae]MCM0636907.1 hypothetical protein [Klebsiella pneumoniae]MCM2146423.1 hypothetical protein [Klebsiella pneumoniae]SUX95602.1 Uncharacterised protein [Citrobacter koseri]
MTICTLSRNCITSQVSSTWFLLLSVWIIGEHPDEDNFPPNFWIISAVAEQLGALSVEADFTRPHLEKMVRAVWKAAEQTPYASDFRRIYNDAIKNAQFEDPVEALMFGA